MYRQSRRRAATEQTRARLIDAARALFARPGVTLVTLDDVARAATVSRQTVYTHFGSRAGLVLAVAQDSMLRSGFERLAAALALPDPVEALWTSLSEGLRIYAAEHPVIRGTYALGAADPHATPVVAQLEAARSEAADLLANRLANDGRLARGWSIEDARRALVILTSFQTFDVLFTGQGLAAEVVSELVVKLARGMVDPNVRRGRQSVHG
jgi:AcrR family transcriptional regulator